MDMAFDAFMVSALVKEFNEKLTGGRVNKIAQPEKDEIIFTIKNYDNFKLLLSCNASLPIARLTDENKQAPITAPAFCMLLRKHIGSARITGVSQSFGLERVITLSFEHLDEMGDTRQKKLHIELMGKHSNIIFTDDEEHIIDSVKRVSSAVSSLREVLPGRNYFLPQTSEKHDFFNETIDFAAFSSLLKEQSFPVFKALSAAFSGFSTQLSSEICYLAGVDADCNSSSLDDSSLESLFVISENLVSKAKRGEFTPCIAYKDGLAKEFSCFELRSYHEAGYELKFFDSVSELLGEFYSSKEKQSRITQKSAALRKNLSNAIERTVKKLELQRTQLKSTEKRDKYKVYGELITAFGYDVEEGSKSMTCTNYYDGNEITIPLDDTIPVMANAKRYFDRYSKLKRTFDAVTVQLAASEEELYHLKSIQNSLDIAESESDLALIRQELEEFGYVKKSHLSNAKGKKNVKTRVKASLPLHYRTPEGYDIYVGRNNYQNDELTFKFASGGDWWFHSKTIPGSHVILKSKGEEIPDRVFEYAASAAAYFSSDKSGGKVEIDYLLRKDVKKPNGSKPGFVVYYTNYSMVASASLDGLTEITD